MPIWSAEFKELEKLYDSFKGHLPELEKELGQLIKFDDPNVVLLYSRRCLEVIITDLCESELKRPRKTEPLKGIIDKLNREGKVPSHIITSMHGLNDLATYGAHPKDFDPHQVKPVLNNLGVILLWYLRYKDLHIKDVVSSDTQEQIQKPVSMAQIRPKNKTKQIITYSISFLLILAAVLVITKFNVPGIKVEKSIAVLPFRNDSRDSATAIFMNGVMEEILNRLQAIKELTLISRTSVEQYRNTVKSLPEIARERHVNYIVEGSGQKYGDSLILWVQLIEIRKGRERHLMGKSIRHKLESASAFINVQSLIAQSIASELNATITPQEKRLIEKLPTDNLEAYEAYLKGQFYWRELTTEALDIALSYFERAKEIDPDYALAYAGIADVWNGRLGMGMESPEIAGTKIFEAAMKALSLDSTIAEVHYTLAGMYTYGMFDWESGERSYKKAIELKPNYPEARLWYSILLNILGRPDEARVQAETGIAQDPVNPLILTLYGADMEFFRQNGDALNIYQKVIEKDASSILATGLLGPVYFSLGNFNEAFESVKSFYTLQYSNLSHAFNGEATKETDILTIIGREADTLASQRSNSYIMPMYIVDLYIMSGEYNKALDWLEKAFEEKDSNLPFAFSKPLYAPLKDEPRFKEIAREMNLPITNLKIK